MLRRLRNAFFAGLILILPIGVTLLVINFVFNRVGKPVSGVFFPWLHDLLPDEAVLAQWIAMQFSYLVAVLLVVLLIVGIGFLSNYVLGKMVVQLGEQILYRVPFVNTVYKTVKQIVDTFASQEKAVFQEVVLIQYPREGLWAIGFLTSKGKGEIQYKTPKPVANVFVPTTPNPTSGFLLMVPVDEIVSLDMPIGDGMKLIISGGAVVPPFVGKTGVAGGTASGPGVVAQVEVPVREIEPRTR